MNRFTFGQNALNGVEQIYVGGKGGTTQHALIPTPQVTLWSPPASVLDGQGRRVSFRSLHAHSFL